MLKNQGNATGCEQSHSSHYAASKDQSAVEIPKKRRKSGGKCAQFK